MAARRRPRPTSCWLVLVLLLLPLAGVAPPARDARAATPPNVLLIVSDDQRWDTMHAMPLTSARIGGQGASFANAFVTTPLCCPSRASIFTGLLASHHGIHLNGDPLAEGTPTFVHTLHDAGYRTGIVGVKYLNSWNSRAPRPEFDHWAVGDYPGPEPGRRYFSRNGVDVPIDDYLTWVYRDEAQRFLSESLSASDPFMLVFAPKAPHLPIAPAPGDEQLYADLPLHRPPSWNEQDVSDKPGWFPRLLSPPAIERIDATRRGQLQMLHSLDLAVDALLTTLEQAGELDDTLVIFMSDNGYFWGEHRLEQKSYPYEEGIRIPLAIRYPPLVPAGVVEQRLVANIDIAPTILAATGLGPAWQPDGRSLLSLFDGSAAGWRDALLLEGWGVPFVALRTERYVYIENGGPRRELYDLWADPWQLASVVDAPAYQGVVGELEARLDQLAPDRFAGRIFPDASVRARYDSWVGHGGRFALGGSYRASVSVWKPLRFTTGPASTLRIHSFRGPDQGLMEVTIDGASPLVYDLYAPGIELQHTIAIEGLAAVAHEVEIRPAGEHNLASTGSQIRIDAVGWGDVTLDETDPALRWGGWTSRAAPGATDGVYRVATVANASVYARATATSVALLTARGPRYGIAELYVDGELVRTIDLYSPVQEWGVELRVDGLDPVAHQLRLRVTGERNQWSKGTAVVFDGFVVR